MPDISIPVILEDDVLLNKKQLRKIIPYSSVHIDRLVKAGKFPRPIVIGHQHFWRTGTIRELVRTAEGAAR
jgi:predicted DNA-binding transcriptional regulator AlpA